MGSERPLGMERSDSSAPDACISAEAERGGARTVGSGKEILLINFIKVPLFATRPLVILGIIHMYELQTCEISLLWG